MTPTEETVGHAPSEAGSPALRHPRLFRQTGWADTSASGRGLRVLAAPPRSALPQLCLFSASQVPRLFQTGARQSDGFFVGWDRALQRGRRCRGRRRRVHADAFPQLSRRGRFLCPRSAPAAVLRHAFADGRLPGAGLSCRGPEPGLVSSAAFPLPAAPRHLPGAAPAAATSAAHPSSSPAAAVAPACASAARALPREESLAQKEEQPRRDAGRGAAPA